MMFCLFQIKILIYIYIHKDRQIDRQTDRQIDRQIDEIEMYIQRQRYRCRCRDINLPSARFPKRPSRRTIFDRWDRHDQRRRTSWETHQPMGLVEEQKYLYKFYIYIQNVPYIFINSISIYIQNVPQKYPIEIYQYPIEISIFHDWGDSILAQKTISK